ncbi:MAG: hypothetical protein MRJ65_13965 [Candidatus Brocadiaceae bacterium]|nr:hypothetical protein [Candidatus Brocadiaceae bacterium]
MIKEDRSMEEIHKIMERLHNKRVNLNSEEVIKEMKECAEKVKKKYTAKLKSPDQLVKKK